MAAARARVETDLSFATRMQHVERIYERLADGSAHPFEVEAFKKHCLLNGLDGIGLTLEKVPAIAAYESRNRAERPWA